MFGRAFTVLFGAMLLSPGFWAAVLVLAGVGWLIDNPAVAIGLAVTVVTVVALVMFLSRREQQRLPVPGVGTVPVRKFQCNGCGLLGRLRVEKRTVAVEGGTARWPFVTCRNCGHEEQVPGRAVR